MAPERRTLVIVREVLIAFLLLLTFMFIVNMTNALTALPAIAATLDMMVPRKKAPKFHGVTFEEGAKA